MGTETRIVVNADTQVDELLDQADRTERVVVLRKGRRYRLESDGIEDIEEPRRSIRDLPTYDGEPYGPDRVVESLHAFRVTISSDEADRMIADIYRWREEGSRGPDQP